MLKPFPDEKERRRKLITYTIIIGVVALALMVLMPEEANAWIARQLGNLSRFLQDMVKEGI